MTKARSTLAAVLREHGPLSTSEAVDIALGVCEALAKAHTHGIVHGALGPHCVWLVGPRSGPSTEIEILARASGEGMAPLVRGEKVGWALGASDSLAPEQCDVHPVADARTDVWAVGALMHRMLAGAPYGTRHAPALLASVPRALVDVVLACLATDPARRPQTVAEVADRIASFASWSLDQESDPPRLLDAVTLRNAQRIAGRDDAAAPPLASHARMAPRLVLLGLAAVLLLGVTTAVRVARPRGASLASEPAPEGLATDTTSATSVTAPPVNLADLLPPAAFVLPSPAVLPDVPRGAARSRVAPPRVTTKPSEHAPSGADALVLRDSARR